MKIADRLFVFRTCIKQSPLAPEELFAALDLDFNTYDDLENHTSITTFYAATPEERDGALALFQQARKIWENDLGVEISEPELSEIPKEEWSESWKKYFHPIEISERLLILPSWLNDPPKPGQKVLTIDPGMSFGTGQHATTLFCLQQIDRLAAENDITSMLDAGCGSGILSIAAALSGIKVIDAFDNDPDAVKIAKENCELNKQNINIFTADAAVYPGRPEKYDLVCANILAHLLSKFKKNIVTWVKPGKFLVLSGILSTEYRALADEYIALGFEELRSGTLKEWTSGLFRKL